MNVFAYDCPKCGHEGTSLKLFAGRCCPECKVDIYNAFARERIEASAIGQTMRAIALIENNIPSGLIAQARRRK